MELLDVGGGIAPLITIHSYLFIPFHVHRSQVFPDVRSESWVIISHIHTAILLDTIDDQKNHLK